MTGGPVLTGRTPIPKGPALAPGLFLSALLVLACSPRENAGLCEADLTPIHVIQGSGWTSPHENETHTVAGTVTAIDEDGVYIESSEVSRQGQSRAIFIADGPIARNAHKGQRLAVRGRIEERGSRRDTLTSIGQVEANAMCGNDRDLPLTTVRLPLDNREREALEGMRVSYAQDLFVTDVYSQYRGELTLSPGAPLRMPTEDHRPGGDARSAERANREVSFDARYASWRSEALPVGTPVERVSGVLGHDGRDAILLVESADTGAAGEPTPPEPKPTGAIRIVSANLLNFFNGDGRGGGFPTPRGAETQAEFSEQKARIRAAMDRLTPDLVAVQELENDGFGPNSAAASLRDTLGDDFEVVRTRSERIGEDVITVGLFYRASVLEPVGQAHTLSSPPFQGLSRQPLAQVFRDRRSGELFLAAVNHLKSKGSCPDDRADENANHGQGCWNPSRVEAVNEQLPWLEKIARGAGTERILVLGDMNAYRLEDPAEAFRDAGYEELVETLSGLPQHSYRFFGQAGTLDFAFATPALTRHAENAFIWRINSDWPRNMDLPEPWLRMSDHDPVVVDLLFPGAR